jgi:nucleoside-diphosphate-sugar epimerase
MSRILVTGASGLVGSAIVRDWSARHELFAVSRRALPQGQNASTILADLAGSWSVDALPDRIDVVIHLAQSNHWQDFPGAALDMFGVNVAATTTLLNYAAKAGATHFVLASTGGLYGSSAQPITEASPLCQAHGPLEYYFATKRAAEMLALAYRHRFCVSIVRPFFIYGAGQRLPKLIPLLIYNVRSGAAIRVRGDSGTMLNPVHVDDVVKVLAACLTEQHQGIVNVGGGEVTSIRKMATRIGQLLGTTPDFASEPGQAEGFVTDIARMRSLTQSDPIGFDEGIALLLKQGDH